MTDRKIKTLGRVPYLVALLALLFAPIGVPASSAQPAPTATFSSCAKLILKYPSGISSSTVTARTATSKGYAKPRVNASVYKTNKSRLDPKGYGYMCASKKIPNLGAVSVKTPWGYLKAKQVYEPAAKKCVVVKAQLDIRNMKIVPWLGVIVTISDEFENVIAYNEWDPSASDDPEKWQEKLPNGTYTVPLDVCSYSHSWGHASGARDQPLEPWVPKRSYMLEVWNWITSEFISATTFEFK